MDGFAYSGDFESGTSFERFGPSTIPSIQVSPFFGPMGGGAYPATDDTGGTTETKDGPLSQIGVGFLQTLLDAFRAKVLPKASDDTTRPPVKGGAGDKSAAAGAAGLVGQHKTAVFIIGASLIALVAWSIVKHRG